MKTDKRKIAFLYLRLSRDEYKNLKESIVIFVCAFDPFKDNRSIYTFETICRENTTIICNCSEPNVI